MPDLEDLFPEGKQSSLNCSQLFRHQMLLLIFGKRLGVIDGGLRSSLLATCLNLVFTYYTCLLPITICIPVDLVWRDCRVISGKPLWFLKNPIVLAENEVRRLV